jgi:DNA polymerase-4
MDTFFVSVERLRDPNLAGLPVVVGGEPGRGVVAACSYEARQFGIRSGMSMAQALRRCPQAVRLRGSYAEYQSYSRIVRECVSRNAPVWEAASIDEFYCDLTGTDRYLGVWALAQKLRQDIRQTTGLPVSMGMATSKTVAKIATGLAKPNGELQVMAGTEAAFLAPLPLRKMPGIGPRAAERLQQLGFQTLGDLQRVSQAQLEGLLGKTGGSLWRRVQGICLRPVAAQHSRKSISSERTFARDIKNPQTLRHQVAFLAEKVAFQLRSEGKFAGCVAVKLRYDDFETLSRQCSLPLTDEDGPLRSLSLRLFDELWQTQRPVRLLGVEYSQLRTEGRQDSLFAPSERLRKLTQAADAIKQRHGYRALGSAQGFMPRKTSTEPDVPTDGED